MQRFLFWICVAACLPALAEQRLIQFTAEQVGQTPAGFRSALYGAGKSGDWKIILHESAATNRQPVLAQLSQDPADDRYPLLILDDEVYGDFTITTRFKLVSGVKEQMAGIAFRIQSETNFYVIRANGVDNNVRFYKVVNGERTAPLGPKITVARDAWHELKIECRANEFHSWIDGHEAIPMITDSTFAYGKIGFWTKSDSVSYFGDTRIVYQPRLPYAQKVIKEILEKKPRLIGLKIYTLNARGEPSVIASKDQSEVGTPGSEYEKRAVAEGGVFFARGKDNVSVVMPLRDRNGDPIAAVRVVMPTFRGETEDNAVIRATPIVKEMQARVQSFEELKD